MQSAHPDLFPSARWRRRDRYGGRCGPRRPGGHLGVTAHITPWNYPAQMFGRTLAPALAMGNAAVLKLAEEACLVCLELGQLVVEAGFMARRIVSGQVFINCYGAGGGVELPFGGTKRIGHGWEKGLMALEEVSTTKTVVNHFG